MKPTAAFFWRKLDHPGYDSCRLFRMPKGWRIAGAAVFRDGNRPCHLHYDVVTDAAWRTRRARVAGFLGNQPIGLRIDSAGHARWRVDGVVLDGLEDCFDVDLAFTPATNLIAIRRLSLRTGQQAEAPAAYLAFPAMRFVRLPQLYRRLGRTRYAYESPTFGYREMLQVLPSGAIDRYPGLYARVTSG